MMPPSICEVCNRPADQCPRARLEQRLPCYDISIEREAELRSLADTACALHGIRRELGRFVAEAQYRW